MTELKNRGVQNILIACVVGLKGFPEAIASGKPAYRYPIVHRAHDAQQLALCELERL